jgi:hypothetical protein
MHISSANPQVATAKDTRTYDDYDNTNDKEDANSNASPFERIVGISSMDTYIPIRCSCQCQCVDKCFCNTSLCRSSTNEVICGGCTVSQAINWEDDGNPIPREVELFLGQIILAPAEDYEAMLIEIDVDEDEHNFNPDYLQWLKIHAKRVILWAHIKLNHINFQDVIFNIDNGALDGPEHEDLRDGFDPEKWQDIKWAISHTSPKQFSCTDCTMAKIVAHNKKMVSQRQDYYAPLSRGHVVGMLTQLAYFQ